MTWGQYDVVLSFLGVKNVIEIDPGSKDPESYYTHQLAQVHHQNYKEQIFFLMKISDFYVQKKDWITAVKILNCAYAISEKELQHLDFQKYLFSRLEQIERLSLESQGFENCNMPTGSLLDDRNQLQKIRFAHIAEFKAKKSIVEVLNSLNKSYRELLSSLILNSQKILGNPPVKWACIGMGALARNDMSLYSGIKIAFLIEKKTNHAVAYFRTLVKQIELRIINLGETVFPKLFNEQKSPVCNGFSFHVLGKTELIDTPVGIAQFQSIQWMDKDISISSNLSSICLIEGEKMLAIEYKKAKEKQFLAKDGLFATWTFREKLAFKLLERDTVVYQPNISKLKELHNISITRDLYLPFQKLLGSLALFVNIPSIQPFLIIEQLAQKEIISKEAKKNLNRALELALSLQFEAQAFYQNYNDCFYYSEKGKLPNPTLYYANDAHIHYLGEIYQVLFPFYQCIKGFMQTKNIKAIGNDPFCIAHPFINEISLTSKISDYERAIKKSEKDLEDHLQFLDKNSYFLESNHQPSHGSQDPEGDYFKCLLKAREDNRLERQIFYLQKISDLYLQKRDFLTSIKILNCALALLLKEEENGNKLTDLGVELILDLTESTSPSSSHKESIFIKYIIYRLDLIEKIFLTTKGIKVPSRKQRMILPKTMIQIDPSEDQKRNSLKEKRIQITDNYVQKDNVNFLSQTINSTMITHRNLLNKIRTTSKLAHQNEKPIQSILSELTDGFKEILKQLINEGLELLGPAPVKWGCMGMGSMSRGEMCPYSDLEFAFLIEKDTSEAKEYFRTLSEIINMKVINLGETKFSVFGEDYPSPTPNGFCMDSAGNTPLGVTGIYELIGTPKQLAQFQSKKWIDRNIILPNALSTVCLIVGDEQLMNEYDTQKVIVQKQNTIVPQNETSVLERNYELLAMKLLAGHLKEFQPDLSFEKEIQAAFGVKKELYRPFQEILSSLAILYHLKEKSTFGRIDELMKMEIFSSEGAENLKIAISLTLSLRLKVHLFYKDEREFLCRQEEGKSEDPNLFYMTQEHSGFILVIYTILLSFHKSAEKFYLTKDKISFSNNSFLENIFPDPNNIDSLIINGEYPKLQKFVQQLISLAPHKVDDHLLLSTGKLLNATAPVPDALSRNLRNLEVMRQKFGENHLETAESYTNVGDTYINLKNYEKAIEYHKKGLKIKLKTLDENNSSILNSYLAISGVYDDIGKFDKKHKYLQKILKIQLQVLEENCSKDPVEQTTYYRKVGETYKKLESYEIALEYQLKALMLKLQTIDENDPLVMGNYENIAELYRIQGNNDLALLFYEKSLNIAESLNENNSSLALTYCCVGHIYFNLSDYEQSLVYFNKALQVPGFDEYSQAQSCVYLFIGRSNADLGNYDKALDYQNKGLKLNQKFLGEKHPSLAIDFKNIGDTYSKRGDHNKALENYQKGEKLLKLSGKDLDQTMASIYTAIGCAFTNLGKHDQALEYCQKSLAILLQILPENHSDLVAGYNNIANVYLWLENDEKTIEYRQKALQIQILVLPENHPDIVKAYKYISIAYDSLKNYEKVIENRQMALLIQLQVLGEKHPDVLVSYQAISIAYAWLKNYEKEIEYRQKVLQVNLQVLGEKHPDIVETYRRISIAYGWLKNYEKEIEYRQKVLQINLQILGENHPDVANSYNNLGWAYNNFKDHDKALENFQKELLINLLDPVINQTSISQCFNSIGYTYYYQGDYQNSFENFQKELQIRLQNPDKPDGKMDLAYCYLWIGSILNLFEKYELAFEYHQKSLSIKLQSLKENHSAIAIDYNWIGSDYECLGDYIKALEYYTKALEIDTSVENSPEVAMDYNNIGNVYQLNGEFTKALEYIEKAINIRVKILPENHPRIAFSYLSLANVFFASNNLKESLENYRKGLEILCNPSEKDHSLTFRSLRGILLTLKQVNPSETHALVIEQIYPYFVKLLGEENKLTQKLKNAFWK